jgi:hypothetical protein
MTNVFGALLYVLAVGIAVWFIQRIRGRRFAGRSFNEILDSRSAEHHRVMAVFAEHPHGGTYRDYRRWEQGSAGH